MIQDSDDFTRSLEQLEEIILKSRNKKLRESFTIFALELHKVVLDYYGVMIALLVLNNKDQPNEDNRRGSKLVRD